MTASSAVKSSADWAAEPLATYYKMDRTKDVTQLMDHLAAVRGHVAQVADDVAGERAHVGLRARQYCRH